MKKVITFVVMLSCTLIASAQWSKGVQTELPSQFKQVTNGFYAHQQKQHKTLNIPADLQLPKDKVYKAGVKSTPAAGNMIRRIGMGENITGVTDSVIALSLAEMFYYQYSEWYGYWWEFEITDTQGNKWGIQVQTATGTRIAGKYSTAYLTYVVGTDTIDAKGSFQIDFMGTVSSQPTYAFSGVFTDDAGNTYTLNANPKAYTFPENSVLDLLYMMMCLYGYTDYCEYAVIELEDKEVEPTQDTIDIALTKMDKHANTTGYYVEGYNATYEFGTLLVTDGTLEGQYTGEQIDIVNSFLYYDDGVDSLYIDLYKGLEATVVKTTAEYTFTILFMDINGDTYRVKGTYAIPTITDTVELTMMGNIYDYATGVKRVLSRDTAATPTYALLLLYYTDTVTGTYTERDSYYGGSYDMIMNVAGTDSIYYHISEYKMVVMDMMPSYPYYAFYMYAKAVNINNDADWKYFKIVNLVENPYAYDTDSKMALKFDATYADFSTDYFDKNNGEVDFYAANDSSYVYLVFFVTDTATNGTVLKQGTYKIGNTGNNIALKSSGYDSTYGPMPCSLVYKYGKNQYMWCLVSGQIVVSKDQILVNATNSKGKEVVLLISFSTTGLMNVREATEIGAKKVMMNGQIYLIKDNKLYNIQGNEVK